MTNYDLNTSKIHLCAPKPLTTTVVPNGPTLLSTTSTTTSTCSTCQQPFPKVISRVSGRPFARCFKCNKAHVRPLLLRQHQLHPPPPYHLLLNTKKAQATILATTAAYNLQLSSEYTDYTQSYQLPTDYSILTVTTASQANASIIDGGAPINCTYDINDTIQPVQLLAPIPITSASGQVLHCTCSPSSL